MTLLNELLETSYWIIIVAQALIAIIVKITLLKRQADKHQG